MENYQVADADTPLPTLVGPNNFCVAIRNPAIAEAIADELNRLRAEVERQQAELVELRALADKRTRDEHDGWCEREGECWLMDGPCAGHDRHRDGPLLKNIAADDSRTAEREEEMHATISDLTAEVERLREERRWRTFPANLPDANGRYVCMWADGDVYIQMWEGSKWLGAFDHEITHWQPLPAPPDAG